MSASHQPHAWCHSFGSPCRFSSSRQRATSALAPAGFVRAYPPEPEQSANQPHRRRMLVGILRARCVLHGRRFVGIAGIFGFHGQHPCSRGAVLRPRSVQVGPLTPYEGRQSADRRWCGTPHPWPASRSGRSPDRRRSPADDAGRRASRRSTAAFRETEISLQLRAGLPGSGIGAGPVQQAPCRAILVPPGRGPGAARVRGYEPRPQGPHLAPSAERLRKTPLSERSGANIPIFLNTSI